MICLERQVSIFSNFEIEFESGGEYYQSKLGVVYGAKR